jgi:hypothetical protein
MELLVTAAKTTVEVKHPILSEKSIALLFIQRLGKKKERNMVCS